MTAIRSAFDPTVPQTTRLDVDGLQITWDDVTKVSIGVGWCYADDGETIIDVPAAVNFDFDTADGAGGLDTGDEAADTWYFIWLISQGGVSAALGSLSASAPTMPTGYTHKRRIGAIYNNSTSAIERFLAEGVGRLREYHWGTARNNRAVLSSGTAEAWTEVDCSAWSPTTLAGLLLELKVDGGGGNVQFRPTDIGDPATFSSMATLNATSNANTGFQRLATAAQAFDYINGSAGGDTTVVANGFWEQI